MLLLLLWMIFFYYYCFFIIIGDYLSLLMIIIHDYLLLLMIIGYCNKTNCSGIYKEVITPVLNFFFYDKISQALKSTKKHNQYIDFFQDKILSTLNSLVFVQDKILYQMSPSSQFKVIYIHVFLP